MHGNLVTIAGDSYRLEPVAFSFQLVETRRQEVKGPNLLACVDSAGLGNSEEGYRMSWSRDT